MRLRYTAHAEAMLAERSIKREWVETVLATPEWTESDPRHAGARRAYGRIADAAGRVLRVVYIEDGGGRRVLTTYFDRDARYPQGGQT